MLYPTDMKSILAGKALARQRPDQFRTSLNRHIDKLAEEEEKMARDDKPIDQGAYLIHDYAASLLRELRAWIETGG